MQRMQRTEYNLDMLLSVYNNPCPLIKPKVNLLEKKVSSIQSHSLLLERVAATIKNNELVSAGDKVIVAVSGGSDSLALLHILNKLALQIDLIAVYVNHGLRVDEVPVEIATIQNCCQNLQLPFELKQVSVKKLQLEEKRSSEDAARLLRYKALEEVRQKYNAQLIAVGHTFDDQVEEFFIRLLRGSGSTGLSGMRLRRDNIVRPLLLEDKSSLRNFLTEEGISWCVDSSNLDVRFLRNRVRHELLPLLKKHYNPSFRTTLLQNMDILSEEDNFLDSLTNNAFSEAVTFYKEDENDTRHPVLSVIKSELYQLHPAIRRRVIEQCCWQLTTRPTFIHIEQLLQLLDSGQNGSELHLEGGTRAEKSGENLLFFRLSHPDDLRSSRPYAPSISLSILGPGAFPVHEAKKLLILKEVPAKDISHNSFQEPDETQLKVDLAKISFPLQLRSTVPGDRFRPCNTAGHKKISRFFNEKKIPKKERPAWPVLVSGDAIVAILGQQIDHKYCITDTTTRLLTISWQNIK